MQFKAYRLARKVTLTYVIVAGCWILFSDGLVGIFIRDPDTTIRLSMYKGWAFVILTGILLYVVLKRLLERWEQEVEKRQLMEISMQQSEEFKQAILDSVATYIAVLDHTGKILAVNARWENFARKNPASTGELSGNIGVGTSYLEQCRQCTGASAAGAMNAHAGILAVLEGRLETFTHEYRWDSQGTQHWFGMSVTPLGKAGRAVVVSHTDITRQKLVEVALRDSEEKYRGIFQSSRDAINTVDPATGTFTSGNPAALKLFGVGSEAEFLAHSPAHFSPERQPDGRLSAEAVKVMIGITMREGTHFFEWTHRRASGEEFPTDVLLTRVEHGGKNLILATIRDITERQRAKEKLARLATAVEQATEAIIITDTQGSIQYVNPAFEKVSGYSSAEAIGQNPRLLKSGKQDQEFYRRMWEQLKGGEIWTGRFMNRNKNGTFFEEDVTITPIRDAKGKIMNYVAVKRDVTREVQLENQFRQAQKMEAIGTLAGGIAHDFNNILAAMLGYGYLLTQDTEGNVAAQESIAEILKAAARAKDLVQQILTFSRQREQKREVIHLDSVVREALKFLRASLPANIKIEAKLEADAPAVLADPTQIYQVTMNLATNALHAMEGKIGSMIVKLEAFLPDIDFIRQHPELRPFEYACLTVADTGQGMDNKTLERIFDPFFTTKPVGKGTGLGLSVVHGIVKSHDGVITVESTPGEGTVFRIYFPAQIAAQITVDAGASSSFQGRGQKILLLDDEPALTQLFQRLLARLNYQVTTCNQADEAIRIFRENPAAFDLVITDFTMPEMNGLEVARQLHAIRADLPIILASGFSSALGSQDVRTAGVVKVIEKPVTLTVLREAVYVALFKP